MEKKIVIRENTAEYMQQLRSWTEEVKDTGLEEMAAFFRARLDGYEEHMSLWSRAYKYMGTLVPEHVEKLLDLGCGTGLELDEILQKRPKLEVTGMDLSEDMLGRLSAKHPQVHTIRADYFRYDFGKEAYDMAVSFESLHHFKPEKKLELYRKIYDTLKNGGIFIEADYIACCEDEEKLLMELCDSKREKEGIGEDVFVHFDTPLTAEHEMELLENAGFSRVEMIECIDGAVFIRAEKEIL